MATFTPDAPQGRPVIAATWVALGVVYVVWGSTYFAIRVMVETIPPLAGAGVRFLVAAAILGMVLACRDGPGGLRVPVRRLECAAAVGLLLLTFGNGMVGVAERHIPSGLAALLVASVPLWLVLFRTAAGDRPKVATVTGVLIGFAGLGLLTLSQGTAGATSAFGVTLMLLAALSWAIGSYASARLPMPADPFVATFYEMVAGGLALVGIGLARGEADGFALAEVSVASWLALVYLVGFGSLLAFTCYVWLLGNAPISLVGTYAYVNPTVAVLLGAGMLGEPLTWPILLGGAVIVGGVGLVVSTERNTQASTGSPAARSPATGLPASGTPAARSRAADSPRTGSATMAADQALDGSPPAGGRTGDGGQCRRG